MTATYEEASKLWPRFAKYRKLIAAIVVSTGPLVAFLAGEPRSFAEIVAAVNTWLLLNLGVYEVKND
jgi:hypothetical protein